MLGRLFPKLEWAHVAEVPATKGAHGASPKVEIRRHRSTGALATWFYLPQDNSYDLSLRPYAVADIGQLLGHWRAFALRAEAPIPPPDRRPFTSGMAGTVLAESEDWPDREGRTVGSLSLDKPDFSQGPCLRIGNSRWHAEPQEFLAWLDRLAMLHRTYLSIQPG